MSFDKESPEMLLLLQTFQKHNVDYLIVGGFAVNRYGYNRTTGDLDIYLRDTVQNRKNLIESIDEMGYGRYDMLIDVPIIAGYCEIMMDDGMYADLMTDIPGLDKRKFDEYFQMATVDKINGIKARFLHYNHLLDNKRATNRPKDQLDVLELERINNKV
ncbi:hypothetical protein EZJ43_12010 [Pedobacter changchengzhani]|uniref:Nucleotidyltransferase family protein n=1 Tax=Pedobacter changchengzhani TaxID=2529274 RepID=A0A4R5MJI1_9SPHI|nr:hypothetical protein [Pedobacter changchengzhani]TDG35741.1 hypothetical protein EZJ43_12010 [Pedobacter changchengzhani]